VTASGDGLAAKLAGLEDRDAALRLKGLQIAVPRAALPPTQSNEYYWTDLLGMQVVTVQGVSLGTVDQMMETGANDVMVVAGERERLIPFIGDVVKTVDLAARLITVDWDPEF
jgi:16S rRNA processing protein RimM